LSGNSCSTKPVIGAVSMFLQVQTGAANIIHGISLKQQLPEANSLQYHFLRKRTMTAIL